MGHEAQKLFDRARSTKFFMYLSRPCVRDRRFLVQELGFSAVEAVGIQAEVGRQFRVLLPQEWFRLRGKKKVSRHI